MAYLVEVRAGFRGNAFEDLHILNETLTSSINFGQSGTILPGRADSRVDQALSPSRVKTHRFGVHTGNLSARDKTVGKDLSLCAHQITRKDVHIPDPGCLEQFRGKISGFIGL